MNRDRLAGIDNPEGYIYKIAANLTLDHFRKLEMEHKILNRLQTVKVNTADASAQSVIDLRETQKIIDQAVHRLPQQRKLIYTMRQNGMSYDEIAAKLGLSANTVRNQLISAGKFIRGYLFGKWYFLACPDQLLRDLIKLFFWTMVHILFPTVLIT